MDGTQTPENSPTNGGQVQPGTTITPGGVVTPSESSPEPVAPQSPQSPVDPAAVPSTPAPSPVQQPEPAASLPDDQPVSADLEPRPAPDEQSSSISWTASEFIEHQKSAGWYGSLLGMAVVAAIVVWLLTKDVFSSVVVVIAVGILASYAARRPRQLQYTIDDHGVTVGQKQYPFGNFRSFSLVHDGGPFSSIEFMPLKRFALPLTIYYAPDDEEAISNTIAMYVPYQERKRDAVDSLMHRIRF